MKTARRRRNRGWLRFAGLLALAGAVLLTLDLLPELQARHQWIALAASFAPYGIVAWIAAAIVVLAAARHRARLWLIPLAVGLVAHSLMLVPYLPGPARAVAGQRTLGLLELNLRFGQADLSELAAAVDAAAPDLLVLTEVTKADAEAFDQPKWRKRMPYRVGTGGKDFDPVTGGDPTGTMVLSRLPIKELERTGDTSFTNLAVQVERDGRPFVLVAAHPVNPVHGLSGWLRDGQAVAHLAERYADGPLVVAGDLNATGEHLTLRNLLARAKLTDAAEGQGWQPTYPADEWFPPLIAIDHVLVSAQVQATGLSTVRVTGTDHLGLLARLTIS